MAIAKSTLQLNEAYYAGFHWDSWIGPKVSNNSPADAQVMAEVERVFQSSNKIAECVDRYRRSLTAKPAAWKVTGGNEEAITKEIEQLLEWLIPKSARERSVKALSRHRDSSGVGNPEGVVELFFPNAISEAMHCRMLGGKGYLRLWQPERFQSASEAYKRVALHAPDPGAVEFENDKEGFPYRCKYKFAQGDKELTEVQELDEQGQTVIWIEDSKDATTQGENNQGRITIDLGGRFSIIPLRGTPIVSEPSRRLQNGVNYALTLMMQNLQTGGFFRDIISNGLPPGNFNDDGEFVPDPDGWVEGIGQKLVIQGKPIFDEDGNVKNYTTPSIDTREPVNVQYFIDSIQAISTLIYENFGQGHILAADATISGVSREQLRSDFELALQEDANALRVALSELYTVAYILSKNAEGVPEFSIQVTPQIATAEPSPDQIGATINRLNATLVSRYTAMQETGIENPEAEMERIEEEKAAELEAQEPDIDELTQGAEDGPPDEDEDSGGDDGDE